MVFIPQLVPFIPIPRGLVPVAIIASHDATASLHASKEDEFLLTFIFPATLRRDVV
jgi:hypothetical protein